MMFGRNMTARSHDNGNLHPDGLGSGWRLLLSVHFPYKDSKFSRKNARGNITIKLCSVGGPKADPGADIMALTRDPNTRGKPRWESEQA